MRPTRGTRGTNGGRPAAPRRRGTLAMVIAGTLLVASATGVVAAPEGGTPPSISLKAILSGYSRPVLVANAPGVAGRLYVVEQTGRIRVARQVDGAWVKEGVYLDLTAFASDPTVQGSGERGLLGLAFHPDHATNGLLYVSYTQRHPTDPFGGGDSVIAEYRRSSPTAVDTASRRVLMVVDQPFANHNGGHIVFGPDRRLYIGFGDGGGHGDPEDRAQQLGTVLGKLLRISPADPDGSGPLTYTVPADNPFVGRTGARPEIWSRGLRNPWRFSFDRRTGDLLIGDVGEAIQEEIDRARAVEGSGAGRGFNFGWDRCEGNRTYPGNEPCDHQARGFRAPLFTYLHAVGGPADDGCSVTGGHVFRGPESPEWLGVYLFGDFCSGKLSALGPGGKRLLTRSTGYAISSFGEDAAGRLFLVDLGGTILRIRFAGDPIP